MMSTAAPPTTPQRPPPASSSGAPRRSVASQALKKSGLIKAGGDVHMRDAPDSKGPKSRVRSHDARDLLRKGPSEKLKLMSRVATRGDAKAPIVRAGPKRIEETWQKIISSRYDPQSQFLNLNKLSSDPEVTKLRAATVKGTTDRRELIAIAKIAGQLSPPVVTLSLDDNKLGTESLLTIQRHLPDIVNLSLANNKIRAMSETSAPIHFKKLRELILIGNPVRETAESSGHLDQYLLEFARRFPTLEMLDSTRLPRGDFNVTPMTPPEPLFSVAPMSFPIGMSGSAIDADVQQFAVSFLQRFFAAFDQNRAALAPIYTPVTTFSFSYDAVIPARARARGLHSKMPNQKNLSWQRWLELGSRNMHRVGQMATSASTGSSGSVAGDSGIISRTRDMLWTGQPDIMQCFSLMPTTRHETSEGEQFVIDAWVMNIGLGPTLYVTVHGQFVEQPGEIDGIRSFDRTMILAPTPEDTDAHRAGWPAFVVSDQLSIRGYSGHEVWTPAPLITQQEAAANPEGAQALSAAVLSKTPVPATQPLPAVPAPLPTQPTPAIVSAPTAQVSQTVPALGEVDGIPTGTPDIILRDPLLIQLTPDQRRNAIILMSKTGLTLAMSVECLAASDWDGDKALALFESVKATIPKEGFLQL